MKISHRRVKKAKLMSRKGLRFNAALIFKGDSRFEKRRRASLRISMATISAIQTALQIARIQSMPISKYEKALAITEASIDGARSISNALTL